MAASIQTFNDRASWEWQAGIPLQTEDFSSSTTGPYLSVSQGAISNGVFEDHAKPQVFSPPTDPYRTLNFSPQTTAFGGDWDLSPGGAGAGIMLTAVFADGSTQIIGSIFNPPQMAFNGFFGFISDTPVKSVRYQSNALTGNAEAFSLDNARFRRTWWLPRNFLWWMVPVVVAVGYVWHDKKRA